MKHLVILAFVAACGAGDYGGPIGDGGSVDSPSGGDAQEGCNVQIQLSPADPVAGPDSVVRAASAIVNAPGVPAYTWHVFLGTTTTEVPFEFAAPDGSQIVFPTATANTYRAFLDVDVPGFFCPQGQASITALAPGANQTSMRVHVVPPASEQRPPLDKLVIVNGGGPTTLADIVLPPGKHVVGTVTGGAAYLRFTPTVGKEAYVEAYAGVDGSYDVYVQDAPHDVLVIPSDPAYAPRLIVGWMPSETQLAVDGGTAIAGVVRDPAGASIVGAKVQLTVDGVPSTLATTNTLGQFTVRAVTKAGAVVKVDVTPPAASGLPRLLASSTTFNLAQQLTVQYASSLVTRSLATATVRRGGNALPNVQVSVVGTIGAGVGSVTAGTAKAATGEVRIVGTTDATGKLGLRAPAAMLFAVTEVAPGDLSVGGLDLTASVPTTIDAPAMQVATTAVQTATGSALPGVDLDLVPVGPLQLAGAPAVRVSSGLGGAITASFVTGGKYDLRFSDPDNRGAMLVVPGVTRSTVLATYKLEPAVTVSALVKGDQIIRGASVQMLCATCTGVDRARPIAEGVTGFDGKFHLAVPDPGTN
ncbi:MAG TPA: hypothetical protein VFQ53_35875 [Kofleriaceae bacterium]|nr:hypothetical protein [Kofleriaceae bacterium]